MFLDHCIVMDLFEVPLVEFLLVPELYERLCFKFVCSVMDGGVFNSPDVVFL